MSFLRHGQIYQSDVLLISGRRRSCLRLRLRSHRFDEFAASYSLAGWSPPEPTSALPAGSIFNQPAETVKPYLREVAHFSIGTMAYFSTGIDTPEEFVPSTRLTRFLVLWFTLFELPEYVYSEGCSALFSSDSGTTARRTFVVVQIHSEVNRLGHPDRKSAIHRQHPCRWLPPQSRPTPAPGSTDCSELEPSWARG